MGVLNNSNHPVLVKKIGIHAWSLREEIEYAVRVRYDEALENNTEPFIQDLQQFYSPKNAYDPSDLTSQGLDSCGNPMDDDAAEMLAAMQGSGDDEASGEEKTEDSTADNSQDAADPDAEAMAKEMLEGQVADDDAEAMAKEMLAGQVSDSDAEAMAKEMLAGQVSDSDADDMAAQMLDDQGLGGIDNSKRTAKNYIRQSPGIDAISPGFCILNDLNMEDVLFFSYNSFLQGQTIAIEFQIPQKFIITCEVIKSSDIDRTSKIISNTKPRYRVFAKITFNYPGERSSLREFLKSVEPEIPPPVAKMKKQSSDDDEDEFEDLGF